CPSCSEVVSVHDDTCTNCGIFFRSIREFHPSLAETRGLLKPSHASVVVLSKYEWKSIEMKLSERKEWSCPICMEGFSTGHEVLLSCSHMFHRSCLGAFEKIRSLDRCCPVCREPNYQKKITHVGSRCFEEHSVTRLQALWRGYRCRVLFHETLRAHYREGHGTITRRRDFYEKELLQYSLKVTKDVEARSGEVSTLLCSSDALLVEAREIDDLFSQMLAINDTCFICVTEVWARVLERGMGECAVCMCANDSREEGADPGNCKIRKKHSRPKAIAVLSCSHVFHDRCMQSFEMYGEEDVPLCPMCRTPYEKKVLKTWTCR
ncbi:unnamed protein product, partial [Ectocarpus fasciculatus]